MLLAGSACLLMTRRGKGTARQDIRRHREIPRAQQTVLWFVHIDWRVVIAISLDAVAVVDGSTTSVVPAERVVAKIR